MDELRTDDERRSNVLQSLRTESTLWAKLYDVAFTLFFWPVIFLLGWHLFVEQLFPESPQIGYWEAFGLNLLIAFFLRKRKVKEVHLTHRGLY